MRMPYLELESEVLLLGRRGKAVGEQQNGGGTVGAAAHKVALAQAAALHQRQPPVVQLLHHTVSVSRHTDRCLNQEGDSS